MKKRLVHFLQNLRFLFSLTYRVDKRLFLLNLFFFVLLAILPLLSFRMLQAMVDAVMDTRSITARPVLWAFGALVGVQVLQSLVQHWTQYFQQKQQQLISEHVTLRVLDKAGKIAYSHYENPAFFDALHMAQRQSAYLPSILVQQMQAVLQQSISVVALAGFLFTLHWSLPFFLILLSLPLAISRLFYGQKQFQLEKAILPEQRKAHDLFSYLTASAFAKEVRIFGLGDFFKMRYHGLMQSIFHQRDNLHFLYMKKGMLASVFEVLFVALFYLLLIGRTISGAVTMGGLIAYFQAFQRLQSAIQSIFKSGVSIVQHQLYLREIMQYLSIPAPYAARPDEQAAGVPGVSEIRLEQLRFRYPDTARDVLQGLTMRFRKGELVAIVGENGSGKSTLMKLLCGLYTPAPGQLYFNNTDAASLSPVFFQQQVSALFQDFSRYHMTLEDNVGIGDDTIDRTRVLDSLEAATAGDLLRERKMRLDTGLGRAYTQGDELSGGQWQKIALARALYQDRHVLVLDEPTSAMDPNAELAVFEYLRRQSADRITILITHRLYNLKMADHIYVLQDGLVAQEGPFEALAAADGPFKAYYLAQRI